MARPLVQLTEKHQRFQWGEEQEQAWLELKKRLTTAPVLGFPDPGVPFILDTDASDVGIGAVLSQEVDGQEVVIAYGSRALSKTEQRYCVTRKELLAVVYFVKAFRHYLVGREFVLRTDHASLRWLRSFKHPEGQVARWLEVLESYHFKLIHRPGKLHSNADALSRGPCPQCKGDHEGEGRRRKQPTPDEARPVRTRSQMDHPVGPETWFTSPDLSWSDFQEAQTADPLLSQVRTWVEKGTRPAFEDISWEGRETKFYWGQFGSLQIQKGVLI